VTFMHRARVELYTISVGLRALWGCIENRPIKKIFIPKHWVGMQKKPETKNQH
jgi:hypothetical protein